MELFNLKEKVAIVTGGNRGIGFAIAGGLAGAGATVVIANRNAEAGQKAADAIRGDGFTAASVPTDVSEKSSVENLGFAFGYPDEHAICVDCRFWQLGL